MQFNKIYFMNYNRDIFKYVYCFFVLIFFKNSRFAIVDKYELDVRICLFQFIAPIWQGPLMLILSFITAASCH